MDESAEYGNKSASDIKEHASHMKADTEKNKNAYSEIIFHLKKL